MNCTLYEGYTFNWYMNLSQKPSFQFLYFYIDTTAITLPVYQLHGVKSAPDFLPAFIPIGAFWVEPIDSLQSLC